jgi:hypothetical protein
VAEHRMLYAVHSKLVACDRRGSSSSSSSSCTASKCSSGPVVLPARNSTRVGRVLIPELVADLLHNSPAGLCLWQCSHIQLPAQQAIGLASHTWSLLPLCSRPVVHPPPAPLPAFHRFLFKDQYIEFTTSIPEDSDLYGMGEVTLPTGFLLPRNGRTLTLWARDFPCAFPDVNLYGSHPFYLQVNKGETRCLLLAAS